jgi:hypothetical protein
MRRCLPNANRIDKPLVNAQQSGRSPTGERGHNGGGSLQDPTHAPGWRGRPRRYGPLENEIDIPAWLRILEAIAPWGCFVTAGAVLAIVGYMFAADWWAGHL